MAEQTQAKHTAGTWFVDGPPVAYGYNIYSDSGQWVGVANGPHDGVGGFPTEEEAKANAQMFAAAPDMYKLLCELEVAGDPIEKLCLVCAQKPAEHLQWCDIGKVLAQARGDAS